MMGVPCIESPLMGTSPRGGGTATIFGRLQFCDRTKGCDLRILKGACAIPVSLNVVRVWPNDRDPGPVRLGEEHDRPSGVRPFGSP